MYIYNDKKPFQRCNLSKPKCKTKNAFCLKMLNSFFMHFYIYYTRPDLSSCQNLSTLCVS